MLPTDKSMLIHHKSDGRILSPLKYPKDVSKKYQPFHLYITSNDKIEEGDWMTVDDYGSEFVLQAMSSTDSHVKVNTKAGEGFPLVSSCKKIIATTDPELNSRVWKGMIKDQDWYEEERIPQLSQSFIEEYCRKGGINEVYIEYETWWVMKGHPVMPKVNSHNEIIIHPAKDRWTREEVVELCKKAFTHYKKDKMVEEHFDIWIKENL